MPYISPNHREKLDILIDELARGLVAEARQYDHEAAFAGLLNYACTRLALQTAREQCGPLRYWQLALLVGIFHNIADEFYRRVGVPYEDRQRAASGDVDQFAEYLAEIENP